jgi:hypothetical protein
MHGTLVQLCSSESNSVSKYVDKLLGERFELYEKMLEGLNQEDICQLIENEGGFKDVPLPALIWFFARQNHHGKLDEVKLFSKLHLKEHQALKLYDALSRMLPNGRVENVVEELRTALKLNEELQQRYKKSEHKREQLKSEIEIFQKEKSELALALAEQRQANKKLTEDLAKLGGESAFDQIENLKKEIELLSGEIKTLTEELFKQELYGTINIFNEPVIYQRDDIEVKPITPIKIEEEQDIPRSLEGIKVAFVGGLDSLTPYYRQTVECLGGIFCDHCKRCQGRRDVEELADKADVVFCPVNMNSHGACRYVKRACKLRNKPCYFLRSSGLGMFRRGLVNFTKSLS